MNENAPIFQFMRAVATPDFASRLLLAGVKWFILLGLALFVIFGLVMLRQVGMMARSIETALGPILRLVAFAYLIFAGFVWVFAFAIL